MKCAFCVLLLIGMAYSEPCRLSNFPNSNGPILISNEDIPGFVRQLLDEHLSQRDMKLVKIVCATEQAYNGPIYRLDYKFRDEMNTLRESGFEVMGNRNSRPIPLDK